MTLVSSPFSSNTLRRLADETRGAEIAEAAAVLPVMFMILIGIFWFGQAFSIYGTITRAAQDGARAAVAPQCTSCASTNNPSVNAYNAIQADMAAAHLNVALMQQLTTTPPLCACGSSTTLCSGAGIPCDSSETNICVQGVKHVAGNMTEGLVQLAPATNGGGVCGVSVSFRYPFRFWLPFTSLNQQQIWLQAQAQVRAETQ